MINPQTLLREIAHSYLVNLSEKINESICLAIEYEMEIIYINVIDGPDGMLKITQRIGKQAPIHSTGIGKLMLLNYNLQELDKIITVKGLKPLTPNTITSRNELLTQLDKIKVQGYALDDEECELGARCLSAGIRDYTKKYIAGISVSGPINRMTMEYIESIKGLLIETSNKISELLAYKV